LAIKATSSVSIDKRLAPWCTRDNISFQICCMDVCQHTNHNSAR
jgi:hypothetical protein